MADSFVRRVASISFKKDENVEVLEEDSVFIVHAMQAYINQYFFVSGSTQLSTLSWNRLTYRSRSSPEYCRVRPNLVRVYFPSTKKNLVLKVAIMCSWS